MRRSTLVVVVAVLAVAVLAAVALLGYVAYVTATGVAGDSAYWLIGGAVAVLVAAFLVVLSAWPTDERQFEEPPSFGRLRR